MIIRFNKKSRDDIVAIKNYINEFPDKLDEFKFMDFIISYEYYPLYYQNYHIFRDLIKYHNEHLVKSDPEVYESDKPLLSDSDIDLLRF